MGELAANMADLEAESLLLYNRLEALKGELRTETEQFEAAKQVAELGLDDVGGNDDDDDDDDDGYHDDGDDGYDEDVIMMNEGWVEGDRYSCMEMVFDGSDV